MRLPLERTASENQQCLNAFSEPPKRIPVTEWLGRGAGTQAKGSNVCIIMDVVVMTMLEPQEGPALC